MLKSRVLEIIKEKQSIKAVDIATIISKETGNVVKRKDINSVLYSELRNAVSQDEEFQWSLISNLTSKEELQALFQIEDSDLENNLTTSDSSAEDSESDNLIDSELIATPKEDFLKNNVEKVKLVPKSQTILGQIAGYYSECLSFERDTEVSVYSISKYDKPDYVQLNCLPLPVNNFHEHWDQESVRQLVVGAKRGGTSKKLYLGYPVFIRKMGKFTKLEPLFLFPFDITNGEEQQYPILSNESPRINLIGFKGYAEESGKLFDDLIQLQHELGLDQSIEDLPKMDELILKLKSIRPLWPWVGSFGPQKLMSNKISEIDSAGIYNSAILVKGEEAKFTKGLEKELGLLKNINSDEDYKSSVLAEMLGVAEYKNRKTDVDLIEAVQLNFEQKKAVQSVFNNSLTVITGPPGTGKSQVVTSILVNAARSGWKVLFTSKNNKAVDVVENRVNGLCSQPFVLRLGAKEIQNSLAEKLSNLLSNQISDECSNNYERLNEKHNFLSKELKELFSLMEETIDVRNKIDKIDQRIERAKKKLPAIFFNYADTVLIAKINFFELQFKNLKYKKYDSKLNKIFNIYWNAYLFFNKTKINSLIKDAQAFLEAHGASLNKHTSVTIEVLNEYFSEIKQIHEDSIEHSLLKKKLNNLKSFEDLCATYSEAHSELIDIDSDLWQNWLNLTTSRITNDQRKILGDYISVLKYIIEANSTGTKVDNKIWKDYYRLTDLVSPLLPVWAVTSLSVNGRLPLQAGSFDLVIIDEASQCDIASVIPLLYRAKRAVILGDPNQLRHITTLSGKQDLQLIEKHNLNSYITWGYSKSSCFDLAVTVSKNVITLREHHRSHQDIIQFSNKAFYNNTLRVATKTENLKRLKDNNETNVEWRSVSGQVEKYRGSGACNRIEAQAVFDYVKDLVKVRSYKGTIGVVTPFRGQAIIIQELFAKSDEMTKYLNDAELLIDTVHKFQGDEKDIIIFSPVVSNGVTDSAVGFLRSQGNLFNVAITRARSHLVVIGDQAACKDSGVSYLSKFIIYVESLKSINSKKNLSSDELSSEYPAVVYDPNTVSDWEVKFYKTMYKVGLRPIPQYREDKYRLDFAIFDGDRKLNIEVDGEKYHRDWDGDLILEDQVRNDRLRELGWTVKRFWVFQIRDEEDLCINAIQEWLNNDKKRPIFMR